MSVTDDTIAQEEAVEEALSRRRNMARRMSLEDINTLWRNNAINRAKALATATGETLFVVKEPGVIHEDKETGELHGQYGIKRQSELSQGAWVVYTAHPERS